MFRKSVILFLLVAMLQTAMVAAGRDAWLAAPAYAGDDSSENGGDDGGHDGSDGDHSGEQSDKSAGPSSGGNDGDDDDKLDHVRDAVRSKSLLPLWMVKTGVVARFGRQIIDTQIEKDNDRWIYEFKIINRRGHLIEVYVDARTGDILEVKND